MSQIHENGKAFLVWIRPRGMPAYFSGPSANINNGSFLLPSDFRDCSSTEISYWDELAHLYVLYRTNTVRFWTLTALGACLPYRSVCNGPRNLSFYICVSACQSFLYSSPPLVRFPGSKQSWTQQKSFQDSDWAIWLDTCHNLGDVSSE